MPTISQNHTPCLWFDTEAEDAANAYVAVFGNSRILNISRYGKEGHEIHGREAGSVMTVEFEIEGQRFVALNGGPQFKFSEAVSFQVHCERQDEIDHYWGKLTEGGEEGPCGVLKDRFGLSWQVVPAVLPKLLTAAVRLESAPRFYESRADSGNTIPRGFCPTCGSAVIAATSGLPDVTTVSIGGLDDRSAFKPEFVCYTRRGHAWDLVDPALPSFATMPPMPDEMEPSVTAEGGTS